MKFKIDMQRKIIADVIHKYEVEADSYEDAVDKLNNLCDYGYELEDESNGVELIDTEMMDDYTYIHKDSDLTGIEYKKIGGYDLTTCQRNCVVVNNSWMLDILSKI